MKYIFFGTPEFAAIILERLIQAGFIPEAVVCNPDKPVGRKQIITPPPVKSLIMKHEAWNIFVLQPENLKSYTLNLKPFNADLFVVAAYSQILPKQILEIPRLGTIGVHPSLLPKYRGPTPIQTAILNGDEKTGVSLFLMDEEMDHGPILAQRELEFPISPPTLLRNAKRAGNFQFPILSQKLAELCGDLLIETLPDFVAGKITPLVQNEAEATYTKKFSTQDAFIEPADLEKAKNQGGEIAIEIDRKIRALNPEPGTWTLQDGKRMKILEAVLTPDAKLKLETIQFESKKPVKV